MPEERFLILRMSALGDIVHALPAVAALRDSFPRAEIDWLVDSKFSSILAGNPDVNRVVEMNRSNRRDVIAGIKRLRAARYTTALDFQSLYRSAILGYLSGAPRRIGFDADYSRERGAALFYTQKVTPSRKHVVDQNIELAECAGARTQSIRFPLRVSPEAEAHVECTLAAHAVKDYFVLSPGGGWGSKCWPAERYGTLHRALTERYGWRGVISFSPAERQLADIVRHEAGSPGPVVELFDLPQLMTLLRGARFLVAADTGPLHLASALGTPVVGLYGPTDPARNGPYGAKDIVVRNAAAEETTYRRNKAPASSMLSITVEQVADAVEHRLRNR